MEPEELHKVEPFTLLRFTRRWNHLLFCGSQEPQRGFCDLGFHWDAQWADPYQWPQHYSP